MMASLEPLVRTAIAAALAGGREASNRFRDPALQTDTKADGSPVTAGDRAAEAAILDILRKERPADRIVTEESGEYAGDVGHSWYVDPIDGTRSYARGIASWSTLIALAIDGQPSVGVIHAPALGQLAVAWTGGGAWLDGHPIRVSVRRTLEESTLSIGSLDLLPKSPWGERAFRLMGRAFACRGFADAIGHIEVAQGHIEAMIDPRGKTWDFAPVAVITREAGGTFTSLAGTPGFDEGDALVSNGRVHQAILEALDARR
jgi:histidinol-phosphatase